MMNCIARHNFKLENDVFSNENGGPGILLAFPFFKMERFAIVIPTFSDNSVKLILRFASITSKLIMMLIIK